VTANALASLNALAPHRIICGFSTGFTARRTMGLRAVKLARVEEYIRVLRGLLAKETVEWAEEGGSHKIRFLTPELKLINLDDAIPIHMSAFGPSGRARTAKLGAGWMCGGTRRGAKRTSVLTGGLNDKPEIRNRKFWAVQSDISDFGFETLRSSEPGLP